MSTNLPLPIPQVTEEDCKDPNVLAQKLNKAFADILNVLNLLNQKK